MDIESYESQLIVRPLRLDDFEQLVTMQKRCFPSMLPWDLDHIESQLNLFPQGQIRTRRCAHTARYGPLIEPGG